MNRISRGSFGKIVNLARGLERVSAATETKVEGELYPSVLLTYAMGVVSMFEETLKRPGIGVSH